MFMYPPFFIIDYCYYSLIILDISACGNYELHSLTAYVINDLIGPDTCLAFINSYNATINGDGYSLSSLTSNPLDGISGILLLLLLMLLLK